MARRHTIGQQLDQVGGTGYDLEGALVRQLCFADDLKGADVCGSGLQLTTSAHVIAMGAFGVRFNAHKSYYAWSPAVEHTTDQTHKHGLTLPALDADGRWQRVTLTPVPPRGDEKGGTCAARGAVRYLGLHFSFLGTDGINRWQEQQQIESHIIDSFFARCESVRPTITQFAQIIESVLFGKLLYSWRIAPPSNEVMTALRILLARRVDTILNTGPIGGFGKESIDIDTILTPVDFMGLGIPDPLAHLAALVSVDILQLGASRAAPGRACIDVPLNYSLKTSHTNKKAYLTFNRQLSSLWHTAHLQLHGHKHVHPTANDTTTHHAPQAAFDIAFSRLCLQRGGLAFRATRPQEYITCVQSKTIRPRHWPSNISVRESIETGSRRTCLDPYIHLTTDITVATYYATPGSPGTHTGVGYGSNRVLLRHFYRN